jgi:predicted nucleic acid-binding protein
MSEDHARTARGSGAVAERTTIQLDQHLRPAIEASARRNGRSMAEVVGDALGEYLRQRARPRLITLDTSAAVALLSTNDRNHDAARRVLDEGPSQTVVPASILGEIALKAGCLVGRDGARSFLTTIVEGATLLDCGDADLPRVLELMGRFGDVGLTFSEASVVACAERNGGWILTFDRRSLGVVVAEVPITLLP